MTSMTLRNFNQPVLCQKRDGVATLTLNRPAVYNALSMQCMEALLAELKTLEADSSIKALVLAGAGKGFCAGHDLREMRANPNRQFYEQTFKTCSKLMLSITELSKPVIARVHGIATAAGCQLVATCDLAVASENARFATPGVNIGLFCSTPMVALSRAIPRKQAMAMLLTGEMVPAEASLRDGLDQQSRAGRTIGRGDLEYGKKHRLQISIHFENREKSILPANRTGFARSIRIL